MKTSFVFGKILVIFLALLAVPVLAQDTLHLDFGNTQTVPDKAMEDKIVAWGKTLNGQKQNIKVYAYYHKSDFKKFAEQRLEEMYLSINRKVRDLVIIKEQEAKKGENHQRTRVDIVYWAEGSVISKKKDNASTSDKKNDKKNDKATNSTTKTDTKKTDDKKTDDTKDEEKKDDTPAGNDGKVGKNAGKKGDEGKVIKYDPNKEYLDSTYVNGVLKITKRKIKK